MEKSIKFWDFVEKTLGPCQDEKLMFWKESAESGFHDPSFGQQAKKASDLLISQVTGAARWRSWNSGYSQHLIFPFLIALRIGAFGPTPSPCARRFCPEDIAMHYDEGEFVRVLAQPLQTLSAIAFVWDLIGEDGFGIPKPPCRNFAEFLHDRLFDVDKGTYDIDYVNGGAIGLISGESVTLYPFPSNWALRTAEAFQSGSHPQSN